MIRAIIFDLDGVLVDAVEWHYLALNRALSLFGFPIDREDHDANYNGLPTCTKLERLTEARGFPKALHSFVSEMKQQYTHQIIRAQCTPDVKTSAMLRHLKEEGYCLAVASNCIRATVDLVLNKMAIADYFDVTLSREEVEKPKPSPAIYRRCMNLLGLSAEECLIVEDSKPGILAATAAKAEILAVQSPAEVTLERVLKKITEAETLKPAAASERLVTPVEIVVPMAGLGQRFKMAGFTDPKPFIPLHGRPMIEWVIDNIRPKRRPYHFTFICNEQHLQDPHYAERLLRAESSATIVSVPKLTQGAACTVLLAKEQLNHSRPLIIANSDQWVEANIDDFIDNAQSTQADGLILTFPSTDRKWSYARVDENGRVLEVAEKRPISAHATVGIYYFRRSTDFVEAAETMIRKDIRTNGEFYVCPVFNEMIERNKEIRLHSISPSQMHGLGTPEDLEAFLAQKVAA